MHLCRDKRSEEHVFGPSVQIECSSIIDYSQKIIKENKLEDSESVCFILLIGMTEIRVCLFSMSTESFENLELCLVVSLLLICVSIIIMNLFNESCLSGRLSWCGKNFNVGHQNFQPVLFYTCHAYRHH